MYLAHLTEFLLHVLQETVKEDKQESQDDSEGSATDAESEDLSAEDT